VSIKVLVVNDSAFMRRVLISILEKDLQIEVVGYARNGIDAINKIKQLNPDVVTLDIGMPETDRLQTLQRIMAVKPIPIVMLSAHTTAGATQTLKALKLGAIDFVAKPEGRTDLASIEEELLRKLKIAARAKLNGHLDYKKLEGTKTIPKLRPVKPVKVIGIASSTGGPSALQTVLTGLSADLSARVVIAQHMPKGFTRAFSMRLNEQCALFIKEAKEGDRVEPGTVLIAPAGYQMLFEHSGMDTVVHITERSPIKTLYKPSADVMFSSLADVYGGNCLGVILTGMGNDGTEGLKKMKLCSATVLAQDQGSCIVYGMPRAAVEAGVVDKVVPLLDMSQVIEDVVKASHK